MSENDVAVQLEGWLPGDEKNGLNRQGKALMDAFNQAYDAEDDTTGPTLRVVIGLTEVTKVARRRHPEDKPPVVATRFVHIEVVPPDLEETLRTILDEIHAKRTGKTVLPGMSGSDDDEDPGEGPEILAAAAERDDGDMVDSTGGEQTTRVTEIGQGRKRAAKKAVRRRRTPPGQQPRH